MRARGVRPWSFTACSLAMSMAAPASQIWLDTAAVMRPSSRSVLRFAIFSRRGVAAEALVGGDALERHDLALEATLVGGLGGPAVALEGEDLHVLAGDAPLLGDQVGAAELADLLVAVAVQPALRAGERARGSPAARRRSWPTRSGSCSCSARRRPRSRSAVPLITAWAAKCTACCDEPHWRSMVVPGTSSGSPAASHAVRAMSPACGPMVSTQPKTTSSTAAGSMPVRSISCWSGKAPEVGRVHLAQAAAPLADRRANGVDDVGLGHGGLLSSGASSRTVGRSIG